MGTVSTHIIHERFCCNRGFPAATSLSAGVLVAQSLNVLFQVRFGPSRLCLPVSPRDSAISRRNVMNNVGYGRRLVEPGRMMRSKANDMIEGQSLVLPR